MMIMIVTRTRKRPALGMTPMTITLAVGKRVLIPRHGRLGVPARPMRLRWSRSRGYTFAASLPMEKADIALKYTVQLRNRALSAYEELMRIQV